jgi:hypothetical protein
MLQYDHPVPDASSFTHKTLLYNFPIPAYFGFGFSEAGRKEFLSLTLASSALSDQALQAKEAPKVSNKQE